MTKKISRKEKWRNHSLNPSNIDEYLTDLIEDTKSQYITQGVSFNKDDSYQMGLLKQALLQHSSFSGLMKHLLTQHFASQQQVHAHIGQQTIATPANFVPMTFTHTRVEASTQTQVQPDVVKEDNPLSSQTTPRQPQAPTQPKQGKSGQGGKRIVPSRPAGGGLLAPNPNAKPPTAPSAD
ncbi:hypothetical protein [Paenibacillus agilis]|uniref:Uncharacterized protein n=1 Tax=Paenibacillus agilis TaxID=3020863 RepID=A0A559IEG8_9BACL|nr:hypothetical protein [Paenibacillus agilis]TVX86057.1 hypothetical protein FPZ44_24255 [Paenibacillus agilis]